MILRNRFQKLLQQTYGSNLSLKKKIVVPPKSTFLPLNLNTFLQSSSHTKFFFTSSSPNNNDSSTASSSDSTNKLAQTRLNSEEKDTNKIVNLNENDDLTGSSKKKFFDTTPDVKFTVENKDLLVDDYTNSPTHLKFSTSNAQENDEATSMALQGFYQNESGLAINQKSELQLKDNPLALKVLTEGKIDLRDDRIIVNRLNTGDSALLGNIEGLHQISLGSVDVLPQNSILLEDIDVNNIPEDKDIVIEKNTKVLMAVGKKVKKKKQRLTTTESSEEQEEEGELKDTTKTKDEDQTQQNSRNKYELSVNKKIFEELSLNEYKDKYLWNFEKDFAAFDFKMLLRSLIGTIPFMVVVLFFLDSAIELYKCKRDLKLMEEQQMSPFINIRRQLQADILLNDPLFDRKKLFPEEYNQLYNLKK